MNEVQARFIALLKQETSVLDELHELLLKENTALKERDSQLITSLADEKNTRLNQLGMLDTQRQLYIDDETHHQEIYVDETSYSLKIRQLNNDIAEALKNCKHQNKVNGGIIELSQLFNTKILDIMNGDFDKQTTYSAEGKNKADTNQHSFARV
jgi:flagellar biosynthesis/type III secretory pathway chaperone